MAMSYYDCLLLAFVAYCLFKAARCKQNQY